MAVIANTANMPLKIGMLLPLLANLHPDTAVCLGFTENKKYTFQNKPKTCRAPAIYFAHHIYRVRTAGRDCYMLTAQFDKTNINARWHHSDDYIELDFLPLAPLPEFVQGDDPMAEYIPTVGMVIKSLEGADPECGINLAYIGPIKKDVIWSSIVHLFTFPTLDGKQVCVLGNDMCAWNEYENMVIQGNELVVGRQRFVAAAAELGMETTSTAKYELRKYKKLGREK